MSYLVHQLTSLKLVLFFLQKKFICTKNLYSFTNSLGCQCHPGSTDFLHFPSWWNQVWLETAGTGSCWSRWPCSPGHYPHLSRHIWSDEMRGKCFKNANPNIQMLMSWAVRGCFFYPLVRLVVEGLHFAGGGHWEDDHEGGVDDCRKNKQPTPLRYARLVLKEN